MIWIILAIIAPLWLLQNTIHELSHGLTIRYLCNFDFKIWPFPSNDLGRFTFAHTTFIPRENSTDPTDRDYVFIFGAPLFVNIAMILVLYVIIFILPATIALPISLMCWFNLIDFSMAFSIFKSDGVSDIWTIKKLSEISIDKLRWIVLGVFLACLFGNIFVTHYLLTASL